MIEENRGKRNTNKIHVGEWLSISSNPWSQIPSIQPKIPFRNSWEKRKQCEDVHLPTGFSPLPKAPGDCQWPPLGAGCPPSVLISVGTAGNQPWVDNSLWQKYCPSSTPKKGQRAWFCSLVEIASVSKILTRATVNSDLSLVAGFTSQGYISTLTGPFQRDNPSDDDDSWLLQCPQSQSC